MPRRALEALLLLVLACGHSSTAPAPVVIGTITSRAARLIGIQTPTGVQVDSFPQMLVQGQPPTCENSAYLGLAAVRRVWYAGDVPADTTALRVGAQVRVWSPGIMLESCPPQTAADQIQIDSPAPAP